jgi:hypothetical protein
MTAAAVLWVDGDTAHAAQARQLLGERHPQWRVVHSTTPEASAAAFAYDTWDAVVL